MVAAGLGHAEVTMQFIRHWPTGSDCPGSTRFAARTANGPSSRRVSGVALTCALLLATDGCGTIAVAETPAGEETVLFVCEHGSAKSLLAATLFNREAVQRHLRFRAIARGTTPDPAPQAVTREGLLRDGMDVTTFVPQRVTVVDVKSASAVVAFEVDLAPLNPTHRPIARWDDTPPVSGDYRVARDAISHSIERLIQRLQSAEPRQDSPTKATLAPRY